MVRDVRPFEEMKLRLLNGAHSSIAYLGLLAGHDTVATSFGDPAIRGFVQALWAEAAPTLPGRRPRSEELCGALTDRFDNTALQHRTAQIANDGSQKLPQRIIGSALDRLADGAGADHLMLTVAAWIRAAELRGATLPSGHFTDPLDAKLGEIANKAAVREHRGGRLRPCGLCQRQSSPRRVRNIGVPASRQAARRRRKSRARIVPA